MRRNAVQALGKLGNTQAIPALMSLLKTAVNEEILLPIAEEKEEGKTHAIETYEAIIEALGKL